MKKTKNQPLNKPFNRKKFSEDMIAFRELNEMSLRELGEICGIPKPSVFRIETGNYYVNVDHAVSIANAIGKHISEYF